MDAVAYVVALIKLYSIFRKLVIEMWQAFYRENAYNVEIDDSLSKHSSFYYPAKHFVTWSGIAYPAD